MINPLRVVFMGTPEFAVPTLKALASRPDLAKIISVYTQPDRPSGRGQSLTPPPIKVLAQELNLTIRQPENINDPDQKILLSHDLADVVVVVAYAQFLSKAILNIPRLGCINVHSSLLPKYRGAAPIQFAILNGENKSGVSTMRLVPKMDAGPVLLQSEVTITETMTAKELHDQLAQVGSKLLITTLEGLRSGTLTEKTQDESLVSYASIIKKEDGRLDFNQNGINIINRIRAFNPWPGTFIKTNQGILKIHQAKWHKNAEGYPQNLKNSECTMAAQTFLIKCNDGFIEPVLLQPEGKKIMKALDYFNGLQNKKLEIIL